MLNPIHGINKWWSARRVEWMRKNENAALEKCAHKNQIIKNAQVNNTKIIEQYEWEIVQQQKKTTI